jgi:hypothetical protein
MGIGTSIIWCDDGPHYPFRPQQVTVNMKLANNIVLDAYLSIENNWSYTFKPYTNYISVTHNIDPMHYTFKYKNEQNNNIKMYYIYAIQSTEISVQKKWNDVCFQIRPNHVTITLNPDNEQINLLSSDNWIGTFGSKPKYDYLTGNLITYSITENITGYTYVIDEESNSDGSIKFVITNTGTNTKIIRTKLVITILLMMLI